VYIFGERKYGTAMTGDKTININRRGFNAGLIVSGLFIFPSALTIAKSSDGPQADGLIQMKLNRKIYLYSGTAQFNSFASQSNFNQLTRQLNSAPDDLVVDTGANPEQLPAVLGQNVNDLSFCNIDTIMRAAKILNVAMLKHGRQTPKPIIIIENGVAAPTRKMVKTLDPEGIIVAVRQVV